MLYFGRGAFKSRCLAVILYGSCIDGEIDRAFDICFGTFFIKQPESVSRTPSDDYAGEFALFVTLIAELCLRLCIIPHGGGEGDGFAGGRAGNVVLYSLFVSASGDKKKEGCCQPTGYKRYLLISVIK